MKLSQVETMAIVMVLLVFWAGFAAEEVWADLVVVAAAVEDAAVVPVLAEAWEDPFEHPANEKTTSVANNRVAISLRVFPFIKTSVLLFQTLILVSKASLIPSPKKLMQRTVSIKIIPAGSHIHGLLANTLIDWA